MEFRSAQAATGSWCTSVTELRDTPAPLSVTPSNSQPPLYLKKDVEFIGREIIYITSVEAR